MAYANSNQKNPQTASFSPVISTGGIGSSSASSSSVSTSGTTTSGTTTTTLSLDHNTVSSSHIDNSVHREGDKTTNITFNINHNHYGERVNDEESGASSSLDDELKRIQLEKAKLECKQVALAVEREQVALEEEKLALEQRKISLERETVALANEKLINEARLRQAEATLCGQALRVHNCQTDEEPQKTARSQSSFDGNTTPKRTKKNRSKRGSKPDDSSSRISHKTNNTTQKSRLMDNSRGVLVEVSIKVPHRTRPIQLNVECPKEETARVRSGENEQSVRDQSDEAPKSSHSEYFLDVYEKSLPLDERRQ